MLSIAASLCAGIRVNFGTMTKPLHVGRAAQNGVMAAELAAAGFTGGKDGLDGPWGFFQVFSFGDGLRRRSHRRQARQPVHHRQPRRVDQAVSVRRARPSDDGRDARAGDDARREAGTDQGDSRARRLEHPQPAALPDRAERARGEVLPGVHGVGDRAAPEGRHPRVHRRVRAERAGAADDGAGARRVLDPEIEARGFEKIRSTVEVDLDDGRTLVAARRRALSRRARSARSRARSSTRSSPTARRSCCRSRRSPRRFARSSRSRRLGDITTLVNTLRHARRPQLQGAR